MNAGQRGDMVGNDAIGPRTATATGYGAPAFKGLNVAGRAALLLTALAGRCEQWALIEATAAMAQGPVDVDVLDRLVALGLVAVDGGWVRVLRDDVRRTVTSRALPSRLRQAHLALGGLESTDSLSRGWHLTHAASRPSHEAAELALATARALQSTGRGSSARVMLEQAARLSVCSGDRAARLVEAGATAFALGSPDKAQHLLDAAQDAGMEPAYALLSDVVRATFTTGALTGAHDGDRVRSALDMLHESALGAVAFSVLLAAARSSASGSALAIDDPAWLPRSASKSVAALQDGDLPSLTRHLRAWGDQLAESGLRGVETHARALLAESAARTGDLVTAAEQARQAQELAWVTRQRAWEVGASMTEALVAALRGTPEAPKLVEAVHRSVLCEAGEALLLAELAHAVCLTAAEEWGDAFEILVGITHRVSECPAVLGFGLLGHIATAALHTRRETEARELISHVAESSPECARGSGLVDLLYAAALLAPAAECDACFEVVQSLSPADWPWVRARADLFRGVVLRRGRRIIESRAHLLSAQRLFRAVESPVWEERTQNELRAAGLRDQRPDHPRGAGGWTHLTPQEKEIVRLAGEGLTNRQIGERLFLSPRTIGAHLYRSFPKLGIASRHQLARLDLSS